MTNKLSDYLRVAQAAIYLGVCAETLRRWDRAGKLKSCRHPLNGYRLYEKPQLDAFLGSLKEGVAV